MIESVGNIMDQIIYGVAFFGWIYTLMFFVLWRIEARHSKALHREAMSALKGWSDALNEHMETHENHRIFLNQLDQYLEAREKGNDDETTTLFH